MNKSEEHVTEYQKYTHVKVNKDIVKEHFPQASHDQDLPYLYKWKYKTL